VSDEGEGLPRSPGTFPLWPDNPSTVDLLGFSDVAAPVIEAVLRDRLDPVCVGLIGPWGSGKSTVLTLIERELGRDASIVTVATRPWEYDPNLDIKATLIGEVLDAIAKQAKADEGAGDKLKNLADRLARRVKWSKAITLAATSAVTFSVPNISDVIDLFKGDDGTSAAAEPTLAGFRKEFEEYTETATNVTRVVVIVDDLDRCLPESVVAILEAMKLFLGVPKMAFVVAADEGPVVDAIATRYLASDRRAVMARQYLEKIIQIPVPVPSLGLHTTEAYLGMMLLERHIAEEQFRSVVAYAAQRRNDNKTPYLDGHGVALEADAERDLALAAVLAPILYEQLNGNPRRLKRFLNAYWIRSGIATARLVSLEPAALAKLMVLEQLLPIQFALLITWSAQGILRDRLAKLESEEGAAGEPWATPELGVWARVQPTLAGTELQPYLELAASLGQMTFTGTGLRADLQELLGRLTSIADAPRKAAAAEARDLPIEDRQLLVGGVVDAIRAQPNRQDILSEARNLVGTDDEVARVLVERLRGIDPSRIEASTPIWLGQVRSLPSVRSYLDELASSNRFGEDVRNAAEAAVKPAKATKAN
jgi:hypothetical protein